MANPVNMRILQRLMEVSKALGPLMALGLVTLLFALLEILLSNRPPVFLTAENLRLVIVNSATIGIAALGMTLVIIAGGIDLSVGTGLALCATVLACTLVQNWPAWLGILTTLGTGVLLGLINGALINTLRVAPFIVTLGTMTIYLGCGKMLAQRVVGADTVRPRVIDRERPDYDQNQVPEWLKIWTSTREKALWPSARQLPAVRGWLEWCRFPMGVWMALGLAVVVAALLHRTVLGIYILALGSNEATARLCGLPVGWIRLTVYGLLGLFVGIAGVYQFSRLMSGNPTSGVGQELRVIAAVVIGGGSLTGGQGSVLGTLAGAMMMSVIASGCTQLGVSNALQDVILGAVIITAVAVDHYRQRGWQSE
ncbi:MAG: ribonucleotide-diphosphate reductase subunit alpha [Planctomycetaceae bacterium]|nr:MAG: ribonucleotide-diphosphate reductase subunit alpha [Planctomycetaceae bacterium]